MRMGAYEPGGPDTTNAADGTFDDPLLLTLTEDGDGWLGLVTLDVEPS